jgi:hypothetical protein
MRNFALLNEENIVINISIGDDDWDSTGWVEYTDKNCGIGYTYNANLNSFIEPICHAEAILDELTAQWICENEAHNELS